ncbi:hypothetical protein CCHL11_07266 [Colletotrichum chlorophyti]|uniref:C6 zinc finger domain protein n=1 Tax=Colletotrichum chlorophyti TaxID=708187 RepID=A0A1Q8RX79_9PEZI|nr:hypothetical protein CCHL11_07266 [Colletotrichum chlorophyti]
MSTRSPESAVLCLQPSRAAPGINSPSDSRALQYFSEAVGPLLSGAVDPYFWTHIVMQFSTFEPAVTHSLLAISDLYEQFHNRGGAAHRQRDQSFALRHYNAAIHELKSMTTRDKQPIVLLACVLFICIEILQSNRTSAIRHCKHGVALLKDTHAEFPWTKEHLLPLFRRMTEYSFFFSNEKDDFPDLSGLEHPFPATFASFQDAQLMIDDIYNQTLRLMKQGYGYRFEPLKGTPVTPKLLAIQGHVHTLLDRWNALFTQFNDQVVHSLTPKIGVAKNGADYLPKLLRGFLITRYECCRIWASMAFDSSQSGFDRYLNNYRRLVKQLTFMVDEVSEHIKTAAAHAPAHTPKFMFETGFTPMLFFIVITCRHLEIRLEALRLMTVLGLPRENLWELNALVAVGKRTIEIEHDISLDDVGRPLTPIPPTLSMPPNEKRVVDVWTEPKTQEKDIMGHIVRGRVVGFFKIKPGGGTQLQTEFMAVHDVSAKGLYNEISRSIMGA